MWGRLPTCAPIGNRRQRFGLPREHNAILMSLEFLDSQGLGKSAETARRSARATRIDAWLDKTLLIRGN